MKYTKKMKDAIKFATRTHEVYQKQKRKGKERGQTKESSERIKELRKDPEWASIFASLDKEVAIAKEYGHDLNQHWQEMLATLPPTKDGAKKGGKGVGNE